MIVEYMVKPYDREAVPALGAPREVEPPGAFYTLVGERWNINGAVALLA